MTCDITFVLDITKKLLFTDFAFFCYIYLFCRYESFDFNNYLRTAICESFEVNIHSIKIWKRCGHYSDV